MSRVRSGRSHRKTQTVTTCSSRDDRHEQFKSQMQIMAFLSYGRYVISALLGPLFESLSFQSLIQYYCSALQNRGPATKTLRWESRKKTQMRDCAARHCNSFPALRPSPATRPQRSCPEQRAPVKRARRQTPTQKSAEGRQ